MRWFGMTVISLGLSVLASMVSVRTAQASVMTIGEGSTAFPMEFVPIDDPGNEPDTDGNPNPVGAVDYLFFIGKFEVTRGIIAKANNAGGLNIPLADMASFGGNGPDMPATGFSWRDAARFVNWLNTSEGAHVAYKFDTNGDFQLWNSGDIGFDPSNPYRNTKTNFVLPTADEWYKAAYFDPSNDTYHDFPTGSGCAATPIKGSIGSTAPDTAIFAYPDYGPADVTNAGGLSAFGTMAQGGNVWEFEETDFDTVNDSAVASRGYRGGGWGHPAEALSRHHRSARSPTTPGDKTGFRVVCLQGTGVVPAPCSLTCMAGLFAMACVTRWRRRRKAI